METLPSGQAPEQGAPPSPDVESPSIAPAAGAASDDRGGWLQRAIAPFRRGGRDDAAEAAQPDEQAKASESDWEPPTWASKEEHDAWLERQQRSYADRRDNARARQDAQREADRLNAQLGDLETKKEAALAEDDLWTVGEVEREIKALKQGSAQGDPLDQILAEMHATVAGETVAQFDQILDKLVLRIPERSRAALFPSDEEARELPPWEQRAIVAERAVDAISAQAEEHARVKLRKDPVFRKEVIAEWRGTPESDASEPVVVGAAPNRGGPSSMDAFIRSIRTRSAGPGAA